MSGKSDWVGAPGNQVLRQGHQAHATLAEDTISDIDETVQSVSASLRSLVESAKQSPEHEDLIVPLEKLLSQLEDRVGPQTLRTLRECLAALLRKIHKLELDNKQLQADNKQLQADNKQLQARLKRLEEWLEAFKEDRRRVMLGQMAYTLDQVAREFVFGRGCAFLTIKDLVRMHDFGQMSNKEAEAYRKFCAFVERNGCDVIKLITLLKPLRIVRREPAHGRPEELDSVTTQQLQEWAPQCRLPEHVVPGVLPVLQLFTEPEKPLVLRENAFEVIQ